jgi:hypothetical protein
MLELLDVSLLVDDELDVLEVELVDDVLGVA